MNGTMKFWLRVRVGEPDECWPWTGGRSSTGYGYLYWYGRKMPAHRIAFFLTNGYWPEVTDHLCRNRPCCNPGHLEDVTDAENIRRGEGASAVNGRKATCPKGHPYDGVRRYPGGREQRFCTECRRTKQRARSARYRDRRRGVVASSTA